MAGLLGPTHGRVSHAKQLPELVLVALVPCGPLFGKAAIQVSVLRQTNAPTLSCSVATALQAKQLDRFKLVASSGVRQEARGWTRVRVQRLNERHGCSDICESSGEGRGLAGRRR